MERGPRRRRRDASSFPLAVLYWSIFNQSRGQALVHAGTIGKPSSHERFLGKIHRQQIRYHWRHRLGYVGLPLIRAFVAAGFRTWASIATSRRSIACWPARVISSTFSAEWIAKCVADGALLPTADMGQLAKPDALLICVPTPLSESRDPDLRYIEQTAREIAKTLRPGQLVVLESTTYPGTTRDVVLPSSPPAA